MKKSIEDLALFGGRPSVTEKLHVGRPNIGTRESLLRRINDLLDRRWLTNHGPFVDEFEQHIASLVHVKHCIAICNGTLALQILIRALELKGEVIVPSFTFVATAHALEWQGITPVFCDIDPRTHNLDARQVEDLITSRTSGIIGVHVWGRPCDVNSLTTIARKRNLRLIFDGAHALNCVYGGRHVGNFGHAEMFSFHATKILNTFEGGAVVTNDDDLARTVRLMRNFGFADYDSVVSVGINGKMSEVCAAMGLASLESLDEFTTVNHRNYNAYQERLKNVSGLDVVPYDESENPNYQYVVLEVDADVTQITRDQLQAVLWAENILARRYFYPGCHQVEPYISRPFSVGSPLTHTEYLVKRVLCLPTGTTVTIESIDEICEIICFAITYGAQIRHRLERHPIL